MLGEETKLNECSIATVFIQSFQNEKDFVDEAMSKKLGFYDLPDNLKILKFKQMYGFVNPKKEQKETTKK